MNVCFKCGTIKGHIISHHISYNPEKIVFCCRSCHKRIHNKVRKENKCPLSIKETNRLSRRCFTKKYLIKNVPQIRFKDTLVKNVVLIETIQYNNKTGTVTCTAGFEPNNRKKLIYIDC